MTFIFMLISTIVFINLAAAWEGKGTVNLIFKGLFLLLTIFGVVMLGFEAQEIFNPNHPKIDMAPIHQENVR